MTLPLLHLSSTAALNEAPKYDFPVAELHFATNTGSYSNTAHIIVTEDASYRVKEMLTLGRI